MCKRHMKSKFQYDTLALVLVLGLSPNAIAEKKTEQIKKYSKKSRTTEVHLRCNINKLNGLNDACLDIMSFREHLEKYPFENSPLKGCDHCSIPMDGARSYLKFFVRKGKLNEALAKCGVVELNNGVGNMIHRACFESSSVFAYFRKEIPGTTKPKYMVRSYSRDLMAVRSLPRYRANGEECMKLHNGGTIFKDLGNFKDDSEFKYRIYRYSLGIPLDICILKKIARSGLVTANICGKTYKLQTEILGEVRKHIRALLGKSQPTCNLMPKDLLVCPSAGILKRAVTFCDKTIWCERADRIRNGPIMVFHNAQRIGKRATIKMKGQYNNGRKTGEWGLFYANGKKALEINYTELRYRAWYRNGKIALSGPGKEKRKGGNPNLITSLEESVGKELRTMCNGTQWMNWSEIDRAYSEGFHPF